MVKVNTDESTWQWCDLYKEVRLYNLSEGRALSGEFMAYNCTELEDGEEVPTEIHFVHYVWGAENEILLSNIEEWYMSEERYTGLVHHD